MRQSKSAKPQSQTKGASALAVAPALPLDRATQELLDLTARLIARGDFDRAAAAEYFKRRLELAPAITYSVPADPTDQTFLPGEVITQWHNLPEYLLNGRPRPLYAKRTRLSIAALVRRLDPNADPNGILRHLIETRAIERVGSHFLPTTRIMKYRRQPAQQQIHHRRVALALAQTLETNARHAERSARESAYEPPEDARLYEFASTGFVPESQMQEFRKEMRQLNDETLVLVDGVMARRSQKRKRGERLVPVSEVIFMSENSPLVPSKATPRTASRRQSKRR
jgi:hypothetical protein